MNPSAHDVEVAIKGLECDEAEAQAIRAFYQRERQLEQPFHWRGVFWGFGLTLAGGVAVWLCWQGYMLVKYLSGW